MLASTRASKKANQTTNKMAKTYNSGYSLVVTHLTTNPPVQCLSTAERTGSSGFIVLWSYVLECGGEAYLTQVRLCVTTSHHRLRHAPSSDRRALRQPTCIISVGTMFVVSTSNRRIPIGLIGAPSSKCRSIPCLPTGTQGSQRLYLARILHKKL